MPVAHSIFTFFRDTPQRRAKVRFLQPGPVPSDVDTAELYCLSGTDRFAAHGDRIRHNLTETSTAPWLRICGRMLSAALFKAGAYGGDFADVLRFVGEANQSDVILSTGDNVGIPLVLLARLGLVHKPIMYVSIGLPMRIRQMRRESIRACYRKAFRRVTTLVAYGHAEAEWLREWLGEDGPRVVFLPFGVDAGYFSPRDSAVSPVDVLSVGADIQRDFAMLICFARSHRHVSIRLITNGEHVATLGELPDNVELLQDVPFDRIRDHYASASVVALPVKENDYSGATTTLLQAMAMAKPVVVSRVGAIREGYGLEDNVNCCLVTPGNPDSLASSVADLLADIKRQQDIGRKARAHIEHELTWDHYVEGMERILVETLRRDRGEND